MRTALLVALLLWSGCATTIRPAAPEKPLPDIVDGRTTKEEVLLRFGVPSAQFEGERILTYQMRQNPEGELRVVSREVSSSDPRLRDWKSGTYSLVLVFRSDHVLVRHSLLRAE